MCRVLCVGCLALGLLLGIMAILFRFVLFISLILGLWVSLLATFLVVPGAEYHEQTFSCSGFHAPKKEKQLKHSHFLHIIEHISILGKYIYSVHSPLCQNYKKT